MTVCWGLPVASDNGALGQLSLASQLVTVGTAFGHFGQLRCTVEPAGRMLPLASAGNLRGYGACPLQKSTLARRIPVD